MLMVGRYESKRFSYIFIAHVIPHNNTFQNVFPEDKTNITVKMEKTLF